MPFIRKIVVTGGPCAGKTTGLSWIQNTFSQRGWKVLFVPETATELINGGVTPWTCGTNLDYQIGQMRLQVTKEDIFRKAAESMPDDRILIVCDRGALDNKAYMNDEEFTAVLRTLRLDEVELRDSYDAVFHLETAAKGAVEAYTFANNAARYETPEEACALDDRLIAAWTGHPHLRVIGNDTNFEAKLQRLLSEISSALGEPETFEIERKFLIEYPDVAWLEAQPNCRRVEIIQTYLLAAGGEERRVRQRGENGSFTYTLTTKRRVSDIKRVEVERRLTQREYLSLLLEADPSLHPVRKTRYCLTWEERYFEIDVYPFRKDRAILEIELSSEKEEVRFPPELQILREVTGEEAYTNRALAAGKSESAFFSAGETPAGPAPILREEQEAIQAFVRQTYHTGDSKQDYGYDWGAFPADGRLVCFETYDGFNYHDDSWTALDLIIAEKLPDTADPEDFGKRDLPDPASIPRYKGFRWEDPETAVQEIPGCRGRFRLTRVHGNDRT
jgi:CYTH domain-containing protein/predicted ATPase